MTPSTPTTSSPRHRLLVGGRAGHMGSRMAKHLMRRGCEIVILDKLSTACRDVAPGSELLPLVAKESADGRHCRGNPPNLISKKWLMATGNGKRALLHNQVMPKPMPIIAKNFYDYRERIHPLAELISCA